MRESTQDSIVRLLRYQRSPTPLTRRFRSWKHNADILPKLQIQLEMILEVYGKFEPIVYDTQGIHDDGVDIALGYQPEGYSDQRRIIGFQAKSFSDLAKSDYLQSLKAQRDDAFRKVLGLSYYFIVLCTDAKEHGDKIRQINAEFKTAERTEIIEPAFAYSFLHHPKTRIEALIKRTFEDGDLVFKNALNSLSLPNPSVRALLIFLVVKCVLSGSHRFSLDEIVGSWTLKKVYEQLREIQAEALDISNDVVLERSISRSEGEEIEYDDDDEADPVQLAEFDLQVAEDLELLETGFVDTYSNSEDVLLRTDQLRPLIAVVADALARYEHNESELLSYMFSLMGVIY